MAQPIDALTITFPARPGYLTVSRLNASAVAAAAGFDVEELDDFRLAVSEAVTWLLADEDSGGEVELILQTDNGTVTLEGTRTAPGIPQRANDDLIEAILGATVDQFTLSQPAGDQRLLRLVKAKASTDGR